LTSSARAFRAYCISFLAGDAAVMVQSVAVAWHVFALRHEAFDLGLVGLALFLPALLLSLVVGWVADRFDRRTIVALTLGAEIVLSLALVALVASGVRTVLAYLAVLFVIGIARAFAAPAERAILINVVDASAFVPASARFSAYRQFVVIGAPALGGVLVAVGTINALLATAVLMLVALIGLAWVKVRPQVRIATAMSLADALEGVRFIIRNEVIAGAMSLDLVAVLFGGATALLPVFATILHVGPIGFGALRAAPAVGAAITAVYVARRPPERRIGKLMLVAVAAFGIATLVFGLSRSLPLSLLALAATGAADMLSVVVRRGLVSLNTPDAMRGRVNAAENVFIGASNELGAFESGTLAALVGPVPAVVAGGAATMAFTLWWFKAFPRLRAADRFVET
jgi:MFS family permease